MKRIVPALVVAAACVLQVTPANAITGGTVDGTLHPQVGALLVDADGQGLDLLCSGTMISARVFLTAGHCTDLLTQLGVPVDDAEVTFDPSWDPAAPGITHRGTYFTDPEFGFSGQGGFSDPHDLGVVVLDEAVDVTPAQLPEQGVLNRLPLRTATFVAVGYGLNRDATRGGPHGLFGGRVREWVSQDFKSLQQSWLTLNSNLQTTNGGTCFGDSGGPHFYGDSTSLRLTATTTGGDAQCVSLDKDYRLDTPSAAMFLNRFAQYGTYTYWH